MKRALLSLGLLALVAGTTVSFQSCNKIKDEILKHIDAFTWTQADLTYEIPVLPSTDIYQSPMDTFTLNIDQIIKDNAGIDFSIDDISTIKIKEITLKLDQTDDENNWTNFSMIEAWANTDKGIADNKGWLHGTATIANTEEAKYSEKVIHVSDDINFKDYLNGGPTLARFYVKVQPVTATNHPMTLKFSVRYEFQP